MTTNASPTAPRNTTADPVFNGPVVELDVRDDLRNGREPFSRIMAAVKALAADEVLLLRATFEPVPLFRVLAAKGLTHVARQHGPEDWSVWFHRDVATVEPLTPPRAADPKALARSTASPAPAARSEVILDVRGLEPPDPMVRTLTALETLPEGAVLVQHNERVPRFLLPILAERGYDYSVDDSRDDAVVVRIWKGSAARTSPGVSERDDATTPPLNDQDMQTIELDVRVIAPREKHPTIFSTFDNLASGQSMVIINDHDPRPLRYQLSAERPEMFEWTYQEEGPEVWRVRIDRR